MIASGLRILVWVPLLLPMVSSAVIPVDDLPSRSIALHAHRGGVGLRPESTLFSFAYAMEIGADYLEMDMVFTKDEIPVIWHDHYIMPTKCKDTTGNHVGKYIANLTLAELKTLDCGSQQLIDHPQQELHPGAQIQTLESVIDLVECYGAKNTRFNIETKLDPLRPNETLPIDAYLGEKFVPYLEKRGILKRSLIQSFDWRTLIGLKKKYGDSVITVALVDQTTITPQDGRGEGHYPWLGGIDLDKEYDGSYIKAAHGIGAKYLSPIFGYPGTVNGVNHTHFVNKDMVQTAHKLGLEVVPWTVDDESSISYVLSTGVDGVISNYPERVGWVAKQRGVKKIGQKRIISKPECLKNAILRARN